MNRLLAIYAAILIIAAVIFFTIGELNKNNEEEPETYRWMRVFAIVGLVIGVVCAIASKSMG